MKSGKIHLIRAGIISVALLLAAGLILVISGAFDHKEAAVAAEEAKTADSQIIKSQTADSHAADAKTADSGVFVPGTGANDKERTVTAVTSEESRMADDIEKKLDAILEMLASHEIEHNKDAFKGNTLCEIEKYGQPALDYLLKQFEMGRGKGQRGVIMAEACIRLSGYSNNVEEGWKTGEEWFSNYKPIENKALPPVKKPEGSSAEELATAAALDKYKPYSKSGVVLVAPHIFDKLEKDDTLTIWATVYYSEYLLYGTKLVDTSGGIVPAAIKLKKGPDGSYTLSEYIEAQDGSSFAPSIKKICKAKKGVAELMLKHYSKYNDLFDKMQVNLLAYLKDNNLKGLYLEDHTGKKTPLDF